MEKNARFWVWSSGPEGGWVKITLRPRQELTHHGGGPCEEGYHYWGETWKHEGDRVVNSWGSESSDCDGRLDRGSERFCPIGTLQSVTIQYFNPDSPYYPSPVRPDWKDKGQWQQDHAAEAMGY